MVLACDLFTLYAPLALNALFIELIPNELCPCLVLRTVRCRVQTQMRRHVVQLASILDFPCFLPTDFQNCLLTFLGRGV